MYTPTRALVFHSYQPIPGGQGVEEWMKQRRDRIRARSLERIKTSLGLKMETVPTDTDKANMGLYGVGKRRTLDQFSRFCGIDMIQGIGNVKVCFYV